MLRVELGVAVLVFVCEGVVVRVLVDERVDVSVRVLRGRRDCGAAE